MRSEKGKRQAEIFKKMVIADRQSERQIVDWPIKEECPYSADPIQAPSVPVFDAKIEALALPKT
jgi:hypothetical protein